MSLRIPIVVGALIAALLISAAARPSTLRVQRSLEIHAPAQKIFALIDDFHSWSRWAPQDKEDSTMTRTYSGPASGQGAVSDWDSKGSAGKGRMSITESVPPTKVAIEVDFVKPFHAHNINEFTLQPEGASTMVTWTMRGTNRYFMKVMGLFVNMDDVMGKRFETGLGNLKNAAEK